MTEINKEIEEMAEIIAIAMVGDVADNEDIRIVTPIATALHNAGYHKQSDTVREIYNKIYDNLPQACDWSWLQGAHWAMQIAEQYGKEE